MAVTHNSYTGNGSTTNYAFTFPYLKSTDIQIQLDAVVQANNTWSLANATTVQFNTAPANGVAIKILRDTNVDNLAATFYAGSAIKSEDLNDNFTQSLYVTQETESRSFENTGLSTMIGNLNMGEDTVIKFEGATDNDYETTLTVADPTADRTITLPNVTGTVVTTGDTGTVTSTIIADGTIATGDIADSAVATAKIADNAVTTAKIATDAVTANEIANNAVGSAQIANDAVGSSEIADGSIDLAHMSANSVDSDQYVDGSIDTAHIADSQITTAKIAGDAITGAKIADDAIDSEHYTNGSIDTAHIGDLQVTTAKIAADAITGAKIADDAIGTEHIAANAVTTSEIADAELTTLASMQAGTASILAGGTALAATLTEINTICDGKGVETTITDDDTKYPTSGAVVDYVAAQIAPLGGLEVIANEVSFPNTQPASGVVISISDAGGVVFNGSGTSTTGRTVGSSTVTINNAPSSLNSETLAAGVGLMVSSTGSGQVYNYHKILGKEDDIKQLSDDINDFNARYRVASSAPGSANDEGDLYFDTTANKMYVYDGSNWGQVTSTGDFKFLFLCPTGGTGAPTINGSVATYDLREGSNSGTAASVTNAAQLMVSINGVVQKPNTGTSAPSEGFAMVDANTIIFGSNLPTGAEVFIIQSGSALTINTVGDNTVSTAKIQNAAVTTDKLGASAVTTAKIAADAITGAKIADDAINSEHYTDGSIDAAHIADDTITEAKLDVSNAPTNGQFLQAQSGEGGGLTWATVSTSDATKMPLTGGTFTGNVTFDGSSPIDVIFSSATTGMKWNEEYSRFMIMDNVKISMGNSGDGMIRHNGTDEWLFQDYGEVIKFDEAEAGSIQFVHGAETMAKFNTDGSCELYYDDTKELETKSGGVKLFGHSESIVTALTSASTVTIDFSLSNHFSCTMGHNIAFANPSTESVGQSGTIVLTQDGTGGRTASWGSQFLWAGGTAPTLSTAANAVDRIDYFVAAADKIHCVASLGMA